MSVSSLTLRPPVKPLLAAILLALAGGAQAVTVTFQDLGSIGTASFSHTLAANESFEDTWRFSILQTSDVATSVTNVHLQLGGFGITGFEGWLNGQALSWSVNPLPNSAFSVTLGAGSVGPLMPGAYELMLKGSASPLGASYGGNLIATPVPEPDVWAMMLAGLGAAGFMAARRARR